MGKHYQLAETVCVPQPLFQPHLRILLGGRGEKKTLRLVAKYADAWNMGASFDDNGVEEFRRLASILREHCDREGRPYDAIEKTTLGTLMMRPEPNERWRSPEQTIETLRKFRDAGVDQAIFNMPFIEDPRTLELVADKVIAPASSW